jgi:S-adenosylmethionine:tRNA ribosyltransferase-isomerase
MLRTADLDYPLPEELIATTPAEPRDAARLLVISRTDESRLEHRTIRDLPDILRPPAERAAMPPDLMIVNATRVLPARFKGVRTDTGGGVEGLYLRPAPPSSDPDAGVRWIVLLKMRRAKPGAIVQLFDPTGNDSGLHLELIERTAEDNGAWLVSVARASRPCLPAESQSLLESFGLTPVPPYILASRKRHELAIEDSRDRSTYQTVYAATRAPEGHGSVAAPTAGLHFTPNLLARLEAAGVHRAECSLDVGLGTFKPVETEFLEQHPMHSEWCHVPPETADLLRQWHGPTGPCLGRLARGPWVGDFSQHTPAESSGSQPTAAAETAATSAGRPMPRGRILAVGTTTARTLESFDSPEEMLLTPTKETRLLITPGYRFKHIDALLTNFHLPQSTLLALVAAFLSPPGRGGDPAHAIQRLKAIYAEAVRERYRFYSFGDAMLILP